VPLDEVRLENQRLDLVGDDDRLDVGDAFDELLREVRVRGGILEIGPHAVAQADGLADVQNAAVRRDHLVHAGQVRKLRESAFQPLAAGHGAVLVRR